MDVSASDIHVLLSYWEKLSEENSSELLQGEIGSKLNNNLLIAVLKTNPTKVMLSDIVTNAVGDQMKSVLSWANEEEKQLPKERDDLSTSERKLSRRRKNKFVDELYQKVISCMELTSEFYNKCSEADSSKKENILSECNVLIEKVKDVLKKGGMKERERQSSFNTQLMRYYSSISRNDLVEQSYRQRAEQEGTHEAISTYMNFLRERSEEEGKHIDYEWFIKLMFKRIQFLEKRTSTLEISNVNILKDIHSVREDEKKRKKQPPSKLPRHAVTSDLMNERMKKLEERFETRIRQLSLDIRSSMKKRDRKKDEFLEGRLEKFKRSLEGSISPSFEQRKEDEEEILHEEDSSDDKESDDDDDDDDDDDEDDDEESDEDVPQKKKKKLLRKKKAKREAKKKKRAEMKEKKKREEQRKKREEERKKKQRRRPQIQVQQENNNNISSDESDDEKDGVALKIDVRSGDVSGEQIQKWFRKRVGEFDDFEYDSLLRVGTLRLRFMDDLQKALNLKKLNGVKIGVELAKEGDDGEDDENIPGLFEEVSQAQNKSRGKASRSGPSSPVKSPLGGSPSSGGGEDICVQRDDKGRLIHPKQIKVTILDNNSGSITGKRVHTYFSQAGTIEKFDELERETVFLITYSETNSVKHAFSPYLEDKSTFRIETVVQTDRRKHLLEDCDEFSHEVFVGWVPDNVTELMVGKFLEECGEIEHINLKTSRNVAKKKYAFVKYVNAESVRKAFMEKNGVLFHGEIMMVDVWKKDEIRLQHTLRVNSQDFPQNYETNQVEREIFEYFQHHCRTSEFGEVEGVKYEKQNRRCFLSFNHIRTMRLVIQQFDGKRKKIFRGKRNKQILLDMYPLPAKDEGMKVSQTGDYSIIVTETQDGSADQGSWLKTIRRMSDVKAVFRECGLIMDVRKVSDGFAVSFSNRGAVIKALRLDGTISRGKRMCVMRNDKNL